MFLENLVYIRAPVLWPWGTSKEQISCAVALKMLKKNICVWTNIAACINLEINLEFKFALLYISDVLHTSQIIKRLTFLTPNFIIHLIPNFVQNIISFVMAWFINKNSSKMI
jgi:hypothetical protein